MCINSFKIAVIEGLTKANVADAKRRVEIIVWANREKERPTHFLSIPFTQPHIKARVAEFKSTVMESCGRVCTLDLCAHAYARTCIFCVSIIYSWLYIIHVFF